MVRKLAYLLVILAVLTAVGELCGLLLPTLSWPFTVSREMSMLNIVCTDQNNGGFLRGNSCGSAGFACWSWEASVSGSC